MWKAILLVVLLETLSACGELALLNRDATTDQVKALMDYSRARGCIYSEVQSNTFAALKVQLVGTWGEGTNAPSLESCAKFLRGGTGTW